MPSRSLKPTEAKVNRNEFQTARRKKPSYGQAHVVVEADEDGRDADVLLGQAQVGRIAERIRDQGQHHDHHREHEQIAQMPVGPESAPESGARSGGARSVDGYLGDGGHGWIALGATCLL